VASKFKIHRALAQSSKIKGYIGFDVIQENVVWCSNFITPYISNRFKFFWFNIFSAEYNPKENIRSTSFRFPVLDGAVDFCFAASVFTRILEEDARHYLKEIRRTLNVEKGRAIVSIHIHPESGIRYSGHEGKIDILPEYFIELAQLAGLQIHERIGDICGQETFVLKVLNSLN
jgi:hypothetical protein